MGGGGACRAGSREHIYIHVTLVLYIKHVDELAICTAFSALQKECDVCPDNVECNRFTSPGYFV